MRLAKRAVVVVLFAATAFARIHAQGSTGSLAGTVRDEQGLVVPGVTVTLAGTENTFSRTVTTSGDGGFELPGLLPGDYKMTVELSGFTRQELAVHIEVNQRVRTDVVLKAGGLTQQVQVTQTVPLLHRRRSMSANCAGGHTCATSTRRPRICSTPWRHSSRWVYATSLRTCRASTSLMRV